MKIIKKVIAVITVAIIVIRIMLINTFALGEVLAAEALAEIFGMLLAASGVCTQQQVDSMTWGEMEPLVKDNISNGKINPRISLDLYDLNMTWLEFVTSPEAHFGVDLTDAVVKSWVNSLTFDNVFLTDNYFALDDAYGAYVATSINSNSIFSGEYVVFDYNTGYAYVFASEGEQTIRQDIPRGDGTYSTYTISLHDTLNGRYYYPVKISYVVTHGGDCTTIDGEVLESENGIPQVGETADGTAVTLDDIQSGAVSIDDVNLDYDKFDDTAIIDLLNQILSVIDSSPVVVTNDYTLTNEIADSVSVELDIAELNNFQMPTGISSVFPFCLPFDFVRGMQLLVSPPKAPVFKTTLDLSNICGYNLGKIPIEISLEKWEPAVVILRWFLLLLYIYGLIFLTGKIVKGAGA